jgi:hypothetical protein
MDLEDKNTDFGQHFDRQNFLQKEKLNFHKEKCSRKFARIWFFLKKKDYSQRKMSLFAYKTL